MLKNKFLDLFLFDGAAAAGASGAAPAAGEGQGTGESKTAKPSAAGKAKRANPLASVRYGIQNADQAAKPPAPDQAAADDAQATATPPAAAGEQTATTPEAKKAAFEQLIKGDYKDVFDERVQDIIGKRFSETKTLEDQISKLNPVMQMLAGKYGVDVADVESIVKALDADDSLYEAEAAEKGISVDQLREFKRLERENENLRAAREDIERRKNAEQIYARWLGESEQVKAQFPNFDLAEETKNENFVKMLKSGVSVDAAYKALHMDDIVSGAMQYTAQTIQKRTVDSIRARASRPVENGVTSAPGVDVRSDVSKLTREDRKEIARRSREGERIRF